MIAKQKSLPAIEYVLFIFCCNNQHTDRDYPRLSTTHRKVVISAASSFFPLTLDACGRLPFLSWPLSLHCLHTLFVILWQYPTESSSGTLSFGYLSLTVRWRQTPVIYYYETVCAEDDEQDDDDDKNGKDKEVEEERERQRWRWRWCRGSGGEEAQTTNKWFGKYDRQEHNLLQLFLKYKVLSFVHCTSAVLSSVRCWLAAKWQMHFSDISHCHSHKSVKLDSGWFSWKGMLATVSLLLLLLSPLPLKWSPVITLQLSCLLL